MSTRPPRADDPDAWQPDDRQPNDRQPNDRQPNDRQPDDRQPNDWHPNDWEADETGASPGAAWSVVGSAGRGAIAPDEVDAASRAYWEAEADTYQAEHGAFLAGPGASRRALAPRARVMESDQERSQLHDTSGAGGVGFVWGPEGETEDELGLLGPVGALRGRRVLEVGCGAAQCSAWLAARGVPAVGIDIAVNQLRHARPAMAHLSSEGPAPHLSDGIPASAGPPGPRNGGTRPQAAATAGLHVLAATATALPFRDGSFAAAFASYGAVQFVADLSRLLSEVRRVLEPGAPWVFSVTHPIRWAFPDDPGPAGLTATGHYFDRAPYVERDDAGVAQYAEFHRTIGDYVAALMTAGFAIERMVEPEWPDWNRTTWGGWSPERGMHLPGTLIIGCRAGD